MVPQSVTSDLRSVQIDTGHDTPLARENQSIFLRQFRKTSSVLLWRQKWPKTLKSPNYPSPRRTENSRMW
ncbi:hypothetical protein scyTo_0020577 [Scyliorhinus torazame]|uniref:Uncharacterized protein n=1 Tax=Scyliorhinus torazame TaxID=75743 RepID=A0A401PWI2_SCYTO|nr:hypothetical protein [Scyliorhinus torazame]